MTVEITESGVTFGPYQDGDVYHIETCTEVSSLGDGIKRVEFIVKLDQIAPKGHRFALVEAKASIPRDTDAFFDDIAEKIERSLMLWAWGAIGRHEGINRQLPLAFKSNDWGLQRIELIVVVPQMPDAALAPSTEKFRSRLRGMARSAHISIGDIWVLNESRAKKRGLIVN